MPRKKKTETELVLGTTSQEPEEVVESQPVEVVSAIETLEAPTPDLLSESASVPTQVSEYVVESNNDNMAQLTNTLNSEFKKSGNGLTAHIAKVSNNITYILIKAANSAYCFARIGQPKESSRATLEVEFLSNIPSHAHTQIFEICKSLNISDSKRLFFHPSGIL